MKCPTCTEPDLVMADRQGIEIDYCPKCRGIWLDRGELDKIVERSNQLQAPPADEGNYGRRHEGGHGHSDRGSHGSHGGRYGQRRKSWLSDIFD